MSMFKAAIESDASKYSSSSDDFVQMAAHGASAKCLGHGTIRVSDVVLEQSVHVKGLTNALISVYQICDEGNMVILAKADAVVINRTAIEVDEESVVAVAKRNPNSRHYESDPIVVPCRLFTTPRSNDITLWHRRLVHINVCDLKSLSSTTRNFPKPTGLL